MHRSPVQVGGEEWEIRAVIQCRWKGGKGSVTEEVRAANLHQGEGNKW